jgi:hypothetical protein
MVPSYQPQVELTAIAFFVPINKVSDAVRNLAHPQIALRP